MAATDADLKADAAAPTTAEWTIVRCPRCGGVLAEVRGANAELRKVCRHCRPKQVIYFNRATGRYVLEVLPVPATKDTGSEASTSHLHSVSQPL